MCATKLCNLFMKFYHLHVAFTGSPYRILAPVWRTTPWPRC